MSVGWPRRAPDVWAKRNVVRADTSSLFEQWGCLHRPGNERRHHLCAPCSACCNRTRPTKAQRCCRPVAHWLPSDSQKKENFQRAPTSTRKKNPKKKANGVHEKKKTAKVFRKKKEVCGGRAWDKKKRDCCPFIQNKREAEGSWHFTHKKTNRWATTIHNKREARCLAFTQNKRWAERESTSTPNTSERQK